MDKQEKQAEYTLSAKDVKEVDYFSSSATEGPQKCPSCMMIKDKIEEMGKYVKINYYDRVTDMEEFNKRGIRSIPTLIANGIDFVGIPNIVKILHPVINLGKSLEDET